MPQPDTPVTALPVPERVPLLDVLRGFALMGILITNMPGFSYSGGHEADGSHYWPLAWASRSSSRTCSKTTRSTRLQRGLNRARPL